MPFVWTAQDVWWRRLVAQRLVGPPLPGPVEATRHLAAVQSQEFAHACYSLALRSEPTTSAEVLAAFDRGDLVRTHVLRPTWHLVAAEDLRWLLRLTSPRVQLRNAHRYRALGLDQRSLDRAAELIVAMLSGGTHLTRAEIGDRLRAAGIDDGGQREPYLLMHAELAGLVCSGPMRGRQHTYAVVGERLAGVVDDEPADPAAKLARRFVRGHGPVSARDLARWASLTQAGATAALRAVDELAEVDVAGTTLWLDPGGDPGPPQPHALLLPLYDEAALSYTAVIPPQAADHPAAGEEDRVAMVVVNGVDVGRWRRVVRGRRVEVTTRLAPGLSAAVRAAVQTEVDGLACFLQLELC